MKLAIDLAVIAVLVFAALTGTRRGMVLIGLELLSFMIASVAAFSLYQALGVAIKDHTSVTISMANIIAFVSVWVVSEIICALIVRYTILKHLTRQIQLSPVNRFGGAVLNAFKSAVIIALSLVVFAGLPLTSATKDSITSAAVPKFILASSGQLQSLLGSGLGNDLNNSLNFFTVTNDPESEQKIDLGFKTTGKVSPKDEEAMLVLLNNERTSRGLTPLTMNQGARGVARTYSEDMFARGYFSHINPENKNPFDRMKASGVAFGTAGENLALAPTLPLAHQGLMNSPGHRANILKPEYRTVGIGIVDGGPYGLMITQDFTD